jgi:hypothetical protein
VSKLSLQLIKDRLLEADEVKKTKVEKLTLRNKSTRPIKKPMDALSRSEKFDDIEQVVQDSKFTANVAPKDSGDLFPEADFADTYTKKMAHGQAGGYGKGENEGSPKVISADAMNPNQAPAHDKVKKTLQQDKMSSDSDEIFQIPQAEFAADYVEKMPHGSKNLDFSTSDKAEPKSRSADQMAGGPTRSGGGRSAKLGDRQAGTTTVDSQSVKQISGPGKEGQVADAMKWGDQSLFKTQTSGATNIHEDIESGVNVYINGRKKASFDVVNHGVLKRVVENYGKFGYEVKFTRSDAAWKTNKSFLSLLMESIAAKHNQAPHSHMSLKKAAFKKFAQITKNSYNSLYESRNEYLNTIRKAFRNIEALAETKYHNSLDLKLCVARVVKSGKPYDLEVVSEATDDHMALRAVRNQIFEEYGLDTNIKHIFVDGRKYGTNQIKEWRSRV